MTGGRVTPSRWNNYGVGKADEGQTVVFWTRTGESLTLPAVWHLPPPEPGGEPIAAYRDRAILGYPLVLDIRGRGALMPGGLRLPRVDWVRLEKRTLERWRHPILKVFQWETDKRRQALEYYLKLVVRRLVVELVDRIAAGDLVMTGLCTGLAEGPEEQTVRPVWLSDPGMVLRLSAGDFGPEQRPSSLPTFIELTLRPAAGASETKRETPETPARHKRGRPGARETCIDLFKARRSSRIPLERQIAEAAAIVSEWPKGGPPKPLPRTVSGHISKEYRQAKEAADQDHKIKSDKL